MRAKLRLLLTRHPGIGDALLAERFAKEEARIAAQLDKPLSFRRGFAIPDRDLHHIAAGAFDAAEHPFDAMLEVILPAGGLAHAASLFDGLADRISDVADPAASAALAGTEHVIIPGDGPIFVLINNRRLPSFSHAGFLDYWLAYHGPFAREHTPPDIAFGYRQFHTDEAATAELLRSSGIGIGDFDGAADCFYRDEASLRDLMGRNEIVDQATEDERTFVDHDRCVTCLLAVTPESAVRPEA